MEVEVEEKFARTYKRKNQKSHILGSFFIIVRWLFEKCEGSWTDHVGRQRYVITHVSETVGVLIAKDYDVRTYVHTYVCVSVIAVKVLHQTKKR